MRHAKKQSIAYRQGETKSIETIPGEAQMLDLVDKDFIDMKSI